MCGIAAVFGVGNPERRIAAMVDVQRHRGPDADGVTGSSSGRAWLGHNRLSIIDLSEAGRQPMTDPGGRYSVVFNGEIYNYLELRKELEGAYRFSTRSDTEVLLAAYCAWGDRCLDRLRGMFAFVVWDEVEQKGFAARDRFGVKPLYHARLPGEPGSLAIASEIKALHAAGVPRSPDAGTWAAYLSAGLYDHSRRTFWEGVEALGAGCAMVWHDGATREWRWYNLQDRVRLQKVPATDAAAKEEYGAMLQESVRLRFRSDVPVAVNLSGGLDSSLLIGLIDAVQGAENDLVAFTFFTGDPEYDETPWVRAMLSGTHHPLVECRLRPEDVPKMAESVQYYQDEPFGGLPTLAYARVFEEARRAQIVVLLDGQGMDEQWAGYDYYDRRPGGAEPGLIQGTAGTPVREGCLVPEFRALAPEPPRPAPEADDVRRIQMRDLTATKLPRALRFNDRISMRSSTELREPFLDHHLVEFALAQPADRKIRAGVRKWLPRRIADGLLPHEVVLAPKRPLQTPQREWLRGPLREWARSSIDTMLSGPCGPWFKQEAVYAAWDDFARGQGDNSFFVWQWISAALLNLPSHGVSSPGDGSMGDDKR